MTLPPPPAQLPYAVVRATEPRLPLVVASPHSGTDYSPEFLASSALDPMTLRRSEDSLVDQLFGQAPALGAPLIKALFPRAYVDVNREPYELDPSMFDGPLPPFVNASSPRVGSGLGTIPKIVASGAEIYDRKLPAEEAERRIRDYYFPYHTTLTTLVAEVRTRFGFCILLDCHSMPSVGGPADTDQGAARVDVVLGDGYGTSCAPSVTHVAEMTLTRAGLRAVRNTPYAGGYTTRHYGRPRLGVHVLQIELNRLLYMDEATHQETAGFPHLSGIMGQLVSALGTLGPSELLP